MTKQQQHSDTSDSLIEECKEEFRRLQLNVSLFNLSTHRRAKESCKDRLMYQWCKTACSDDLPHYYRDHVSKECAAWRDFVLRLLLCVKKGYKELGYALYNFLYTNLSDQKLLSFLHTWCAIALFEYGSVDTAKWLETMPGWIWSDDTEVFIWSLLQRGDFKLTNWLLEHKALIHPRTPNYPTPTPYTLSSDNDFFTRVLQGICEQRSLEDLQLLTERVQEEVGAAFKIICEAWCSSQDRVMELLCCTDDACASYLMSSSFLSHLPDRDDFPMLALTISIFTNKPMTADIVTDKYAITQEQVLHFMHTMPRLVECLAPRLLGQCLTWMEHRLGLHWENLSLDSMQVLFYMMNKNMVFTSSLRTLSEVATSFPFSVWSFLLHYPELWDEEIQQREHKHIYKPVQYCCDVYHFILTEKTEYVSNESLKRTASNCSFPCVQDQVQRVLARRSGDFVERRDQDITISELNEMYDTKSHGYTIMIGTPHPEFDIAYWIDRSTIGNREHKTPLNCGRACCPLHSRKEKRC